MKLGELVIRAVHGPAAKLKVGLVAGRIRTETSSFTPATKNKMAAGKASYGRLLGLQLVHLLVQEVGKLVEHKIYYVVYEEQGVRGKDEIKG